MNPPYKQIGIFVVVVIIIVLFVPKNEIKETPDWDTRILVPESTSAPFKGGIMYADPNGNPAFFIRNTEIVKPGDPNWTILTDAWKKQTK